MITAGTIVRSILAGCTVGFAWHTRTVVVILIVSVRADLQAYGQIGNIEMSRGAGQTTILSGSGARFAGLVARPANTALVGEASRGAPTHTGIIQAVVFAGHALGGSLAVAPLRVTLGIAVVQYDQFVVRISHYVFPLSRWNVVPIYGGHSFVNAATGTAEQERIVHRVRIDVRLVIISSTAEGWLTDVRFRWKHERVDIPVVGDRTALGFVF